MGSQRATGRKITFLVLQTSCNVTVEFSTHTYHSKLEPNCSFT